MKISVIIPCYNEETTILKILELVQIALNDNEYEIILVDDASTDNTSQIIKDLSLNEDTIVVITHELN
jgi:glycosyltransferase involved in cell wall biosynthesis